MLKNIVFDVGQVLIQNDSTEFQKFLIESGARISTAEEFAESTNLPGFVRGKISGDQFLNRISKLLSRGVDPRDIAFQWSQMFNPIPEMLELLEQLSSHYQTFLLTNTNELHWEFLKQTYQLHQRAEDVVASHEVGAAKPEQLIYELAEENFGIIPQETLFIDDTLEHIEAAQTRGWKGIHHVSYQKTEMLLRSLGITEA